MTAVQAHWILIDGEWQLHSCKPRRLSASLVTKHGRQSQDDEIGDDAGDHHLDVSPQVGPRGTVGTADAGENLVDYALT